mmetsp:Transcript_38977/g.83968  ORF Transcript_38977/g.83968 Transcript_38977/m.83968 type:complete len:563 (-) Transcript_38977:151-1839(-)
MTMENIKEEDESSLLEGSPKRRVAQAYSTNDQQKICRKYSLWTIAFFAFVIVAIGGSGDGETKQQKRAKKLRNKAETMPEVEVERLKAMKIKADLNDKYAKLNNAHANYEDSEDAGLNNGVMEGEDDLNKELNHAFDGVEMAEQDEIDTNNSMLTTAVKTMEDSVKFYLGKVFGYENDEDDDDAVSTGASEDIKLTEDQLDDIAKKISERLEKDVKSEFREKADNVKEEKMSEIEKVVAEDREAQMPARDIGNDVKTAESVVMEDLKDEIDDAAERVKDEIPERVKKIRNDVVEEVTGKKLDEIEQRKRARKQKRMELMLKFQKMQAAAKDAEGKKIVELNNEKTKQEAQRMKRNQDKSNGSKSVQGSNQGKKTERNQGKSNDSKGVRGSKKDKKTERKQDKSNNSKGVRGSNQNKNTERNQDKSNASENAWAFLQNGNMKTNQGMKRTGQGKPEERNQSGNMKTNQGSRTEGNQDKRDDSESVRGSKSESNEAVVASGDEQEKSGDGSKHSGDDGNEDGATSKGTSAVSQKSGLSADESDRSGEDDNDPSATQDEEEIEEE